jgi:hypothetical protein
LAKNKKFLEWGICKEKNFQDSRVSKKKFSESQRKNFQSHKEKIFRVPKKKFSESRVTGYPLLIIQDPYRQSASPLASYPPATGLGRSPLPAIGHAH